jgi:hypothetical protein
MIRANEFISPVSARWSGGWKGEFSEMQLSACATSAGEDCTTLTDLHYVRSCAASASFTLDARFTGSYLRVADSRIGVGPPVEPSYAVNSPYGDEVWGRSVSTSVAVVGQIAPAVHPYPGECGPPSPGGAFISKRGVALIDCPGGCRAALIAGRNRRHARIMRSLRPQNTLIVAPPAKLRVPHNTLVRIGARSVWLAVEIDGEQVAQRTIRVGVDR